MTAPAWGDIIPLFGDTHDLPRAGAPYYVVAKEGLFLHRDLAFGHGVVRWYKDPPRLKAVGNYQGSFYFDTELKLPPFITAQAVSFFRRIYEKHHTEAEVIITRNNTTEEYRLFVPTQRVSHGGVYSIYNPAHITFGWDVIGTIHSHCDFSAYHSSTDEGDARDMDGLHLTIGDIMKPEISVAAMVAINRQFYHFKDISIVADFSDPNAASAPEWWDRYVILGKVEDDQRPAWADDDTWDRYMGRYKAPTPVTTYTPPPPKPYVPHPYQSPWLPKSADTKTEAPTLSKRAQRLIDNFNKRGWVPDKESEKFNERRMRQMGFHTNEKEDISDRDDDYEGVIWEDMLDKDFVDALFDTDIFGEEDIDLASEDFPESGTPTYWQRRFIEKAMAAVEFLRYTGLKVDISFGATDYNTEKALELLQ